MAQTGVDGAWFLAQYLATGDVGWLVPVQSLTRKDSSFNAVAFQKLGATFPDQELIAAVAKGCLDPKDSRPKESDLFFGANHTSGLEAWRFVTKANNVEKKAEHLFGFPISVSPPVFPAMYAPTGAVHKKTRSGEI